MTAPASATPGRSARRSLHESSSRSVMIADKMATAVMWGLGVFVILLLGSIIVHFSLAAWGVVSVDFLTSDPTGYQGTTIGGIFPFLWNSIYMLVLTMLLAVPLGILAGIYMSEYAAENRVTGTIRFAQEAISSVPSIVVGMFGLALLVTTFKIGYTALWASLALTLFNLPLMARLSEQALRAVPQEERSASLALGATKWQTIKHVVLPLAIPGLVTGIILTAGRVFGEAAVLLFTAGTGDNISLNFTSFSFSDVHSAWNPFRPATTLSVYIWRLNSDGLGPFKNEIVNGTAAILIATVLIFNLGARFLGRLLSRKLTAR